MRYATVAALLGACGSGVSIELTVTGPQDSTAVAKPSNSDDALFSSALPALFTFDFDDRHQAQTGNIGLTVTNNGDIADGIVTYLCGKANKVDRVAITDYVVTLSPSGIALGETGTCYDGQASVCGWSTDTSSCE